ncbi:hypothetical protein GOB83_07075 [Acetobacter fabarum]|uniref:Uncharacterized protein n=1 Tax=Acetobacter fabarum TaxID=483199 RepID=A0A269XY22_9PROT|nr:MULTISPECIES: hypothetical protein [Acetobacter]MCH4025188.1 hypothetical protein [Acetobacter fabarum]MCH4055163.1 hypothetical protein [Acetobacter fabarum]MCH4128652.1 hypothetical protein [Acetobacter fabarum]MCH4141843.1 hypothetical protein [Acetobacter fabarum]MCI1243581.1 hypothetical protein [Acetobacter fabarum]
MPDHSSPEYDSAMTYRYNIFRFVYELVDILVSRLEYGLRGLATSHVLVPPPAKSHSFLVMTAEEKGGRTFYKPAYYLFSKTRERLSGYFAQGKDHLFLQNTQHCLLIAFADSTLVVGREDTIAEYHPHSFETLLALKAHMRAIKLGRYPHEYLVISKKTAIPPRPPTFRLRAQAH